MKSLENFPLFKIGGEMKKTYYLLIISVILLLLAGCGKGFSEGGYFANGKEMVNQAKLGIEEISYDDFKLKLEKEEIRILIDVRKSGEFEEGYINMPNEDDEYPYPETFTVNIPRGLLEFKIDDTSYWDDELWVEMPNKDEEIVVYCQKGGRAALTAQTLKQLGYTNVKSLKGGYRIWLDPDAPLEEAPKSSGGCG
jgi:rhodanese-related sulfurtransferase